VFSSISNNWQWTESRNSVIFNDPVKITWIWTLKLF
jgi:hypothetical protein